MLTIRPARPEDAALLPPIENASDKLFRTQPDLAWIAESDDALPADAYLPFIRAQTCWLAQQDETVVGFLSAGILADTLPAPDEGPALHIWQLAVIPSAQGRGLGRALMQHAIAAARTLGLAGLSLTTFRHVQWNAPFYARLGFRILETGEMPAALTALLNREAAHGLPVEKRCAMVLPLHGDQTP
ncbi:GNAT family N-acetyltransferase [Xanthobacter sp. TB0136]|uniref:GNAT family N-acetyltransferase n=1 Tax=Xanthobacter sp. TB0136 TaxID=3459177 RepID=UPI0040392F0A